MTLGSYLYCFAQPKLDFDLKKPKEFEERPLGSEKNADKKFTIVRRFFQNTYTHYNYYFNANNLINEIIERARLSSQDDFTDLLSYYPWSLEQTKGSSDIDSILKTCTAGILLHDLRNDWIDNMYLLIGKAYYLRNDFDSAAMTFQYLNYAFSPKEKDGYDKTIGSNSDEGTNAFTILSKEKKNRILSRPPSRNDGFVWQVRTLTDMKNYIDAFSLVSILRNDPNFPKRLEPKLNEVTGYLYYQLSTWDSAAHYLEQSMEMAFDPSDKARRWFLAAQLYQLAGDNEKAGMAYSKCVGTATDLVMEVYARLNTIRLRKDDNPNIIAENVRDLVAMAKRDKYTDYRDIIYYAAGLVELERKGFEAASDFFQKSIDNNTKGGKQKSLSFLALGDARFEQKQYGKAGPPYDSLQITHLKKTDSLKVENRKPGTLQIYEAEKVIHLQDSLLALANMPEDERTAIVKKISKDLRKKLGIKDEPASMGNESTSRAGLEDEANNLFSTSGTWYFYEPAIRAKGFNTFKERWGARPNDDNWRRSSALGMLSGKMPRMPEVSGNPDMASETPIEPDEVYDSTDVSFDNLYSRIPSSPERKIKAEKYLIDALFSKAKALHEKIEDYPEAIKVYEEILRRRDTGTIAQECLFGLIHCYTQIGDIAKANEARQRMAKTFPDAKLTGEAIDISNATKIAEETYEKIYNLFIEGNFTEALLQKKIADSTLGKSYWKPQLLYIQSVYHIKERADSLAIKELNNIVTQFSGHGLAQKATRMIDVLKRRKEIEAYLTKLEVTRLEEDAIIPIKPSPSAQPIVTLAQADKPVIDSTRSNELTLQAQKAKEDWEKQEKKAAEELAAQKLKADKEASEKAEAERLANEKAMAQKNAAEKEKAEKELLEKQAAENAQAEKELAEKMAADKAKADKELADKIAAEKAQAEKELAEKIAAEKAKAAKELAEKMAAEKAQAEKELAEKIAAEKAQAEKELAEKMAAEKAKAEKDLAEKMAAEKAKAEKELAEKMATEKAKAEKEFAEKQAKEKEALEKDMANRAEAEKALAEKQAKEKAEMEKLLAEKQAAEKALAEKEMAEKQAMEKANAEKIEKEKARLEKELAEKELAEKLAKEKAQSEKELIEKQALEKAEADRKMKEKAENEKLAAAKELEEKQAKEKAQSEKELLEKQALEKAEADRKMKEKAENEKLAAAKELEEKQAKEKAEVDRIAREKAEADKAAAEKIRKDKEAADKAAADKASMVDNVMVVAPTTASNFSIKANEKQIVAIVLEKIDIAYVNEVSYSLANSTIKNKDGAQVDVIKKKIRDGLWLVELHSPAFVNMQITYEYINYLKPIVRNDLITWLDPSKYYFITISDANLKELEKIMDVNLYKKVLGEAVPGKY
jgi:hypothetical protein